MHQKYKSDWQGYIKQRKESLCLNKTGTETENDDDDSVEKCFDPAEAVVVSHDKIWCNWWNFASAAAIDGCGAVSHQTTLGYATASKIRFVPVVPDDDIDNNLQFIHTRAYW